MNDMLNIILGILIGIFTNFLSWWILFHGITPSLRYSQSISKTSRQPTPNDRTTWTYRVKLENSGRRAIIDLDILARLRLKGLEGYPKGLSEIVYIPLDSNGNISHKIPYVAPVKKSRSRPIIIFFENCHDEFNNPNKYSENIVNKATDKSLLLEDLLRLGDGTTLQIIAFGYDEFSGARKAFTSKQYTHRDVQRGSFDVHGLEVIPLTEADVESSHSDKIG